jgi:peroxiredoxin
VPVALRFASPLVAGGTFDGASLAGKPAVLWFWAAWCPRCQAKAAEVRAAQTAVAGKVNFVGVAGLSSGQEAMVRFVSQHALGGFPHLSDDTGTVWRHFGVVEQEYFVLIDASGMIVHKGPLNATELNRRVADLAG